MLDKFSNRHYILSRKAAAGVLRNAIEHVNATFESRRLWNSTMPVADRVDNDTLEVNMAKAVAHDLPELGSVDWHSWLDLIAGAVILVAVIGLMAAFAEPTGVSVMSDPNLAP